MITDTTKQKYVILRAFEAATGRKDEIHFGKFLNMIRKISKQEFDTEVYSSVPEGVFDIINHFEEAGLLSCASDKKWHISPKGKRRLEQIRTEIEANKLEAA